MKKVGKVIMRFDCSCRAESGGDSTGYQLLGRTCLYKDLGLTEAFSTLSSALRPFTSGPWSGDSSRRLGLGRNKFFSNLEITLDLQKNWGKCTENARICSFGATN